VRRAKIKARGDSTEGFLRVSSLTEKTSDLSYFDFIDLSCVSQ